MGEAGTKNPASAVQLKDRQAGAAVAAVLPALRLEHPETLLPQRKLRKWDKTAPSRPEVADMKDTVLPFERFKNSVQIVRTLSTGLQSPLIRDSRILDRMPFFRGTKPQKSAYVILGTPAFQLDYSGC